MQASLKTSIPSYTVTHTHTHTHTYTHKKIKIKESHNSRLGGCCQIRHSRQRFTVLKTHHIVLDFERHPLLNLGIFSKTKSQISLSSAFSGP